MLTTSMTDSNFVSSFSLVDQINKYFAMRAQIERVAQDIRREQIIRSISAQLVPGQRVLATFGKQSDGTIKLKAISRLAPGQGYLNDPKDRTAYEVNGKEASACVAPGMEPPERSTFDLDGEKFVLDYDPDPHVDAGAPDAKDSETFSNDDPVDQEGMK